MSAKRTSMHRLQELVRLHRQGRSRREIARLLQMSRNTVREYQEVLATAGLLDGPLPDVPPEDALLAAATPPQPALRPPQEVSSVDDWSSDIQRLQKDGCGPKAIYDWLRTEQPEFQGSYDAIKRYVRRARRHAPVCPKDVAIPVDTAPGQIAQVDFGYFGLLWDPATGRHRKVWVFLMVLGHSRHMYADLVFDQRIETWQRLHAAAFAWFGGVPHVVVPDNLKAAVIRAAFTSSDEGELNRSYVELARHYGFQIDPTPPRAPKKKGKVEAAVRYVRSSFWKPRQAELADIDVARTALHRWVREVAGTRTHGTTCQAPLAVFEAVERPALLPLPPVPFAPVIWKRAKVHADAHVQVRRALYSVPWKRCGQTLWVRVVGDSVQICGETERIATHERQAAGRRSTLAGHLPPEREAYAHRDRAYWEQRAERLGPDTLALVADMFEAEHVQLQLRKVQGIVTTLERADPARVEAVARRARFYRSFSVRAVKEILRRGLELEPLPGSVVPEHGALSQPRFARVPSTFTPRPIPEA